MCVCVCVCVCGVCVCVCRVCLYSLFSDFWSTSVALDRQETTILLLNMSTLGLQLMLHHVSTRHCSLLARLRQVVRAHVTSRSSARFSTWPACQWYPERSFTSDVKQEIYISSPRPPVTIPDKPFAEFMLSTFKQYGDLTALVGLQFDC